MDNHGYQDKQTMVHKTKIPRAMRHSQKKFLFILTVFNSDYMLIIDSNCFFLLQFLAHSSEGYHITHMPI